MSISADAQATADDLIGTCQSLHDVVTNEQIDDPAFCSKLDLLCFCCDTCGWWYAVEDMDADQVCFDCAHG